MIVFIKGIVDSLGIDYVVIENNGIGYKVYFNHSQTLTLGQNITLFTYEHIREDAHTIFGFLKQQELELFERLISVKGLGPKTALGILTSVSYSQVVNAIESGEVSFLKQMPGIGSKTAQQIVLDLKGKLVVDISVVGKVDKNINDALEALKSLGYKNSEVQAIVKKLSAQKFDSVDDYVKLGLQLMLKHKGG